MPDAVVVVDDVMMDVIRFLLLLWRDVAAAFLPILYNLAYIGIGILVFNGGQSIGRVAHIGGKVLEDIIIPVVVGLFTVAVEDVVVDDDDFVDS
jgi:hypothetical protein